jgi:hypothetical protein
MVLRAEIEFGQEFVDRFFLKWPLCRPFGHRCKHTFTMYGHLDGNGQPRIYCAKTDKGKGSFIVKSLNQCPIGKWE